MSENQSSQEKTEQPTQKRLDKAKEDGQVARSKELQSAALVFGGGLIILMGGSLGEFAFNLMEGHFQLERNHVTDPSMMAAYLRHGYDLAIAAILPLLVIIWTFGLLSSMIPGGLLLSAKAMAPQGKRMNPLSGLKKMFSGHSLVELLKSSLKVLVAFSIMVLVLYMEVPDLLAMTRMGLFEAISVGIKTLGFTVLSLGAGLFLIAVIDVPFQIFSTLKKLKMTKQEVKEEHKNTEGSPEVKQKVRQIQMQISKQRIDARVPEADVVIVNPTHYSVAIKYDASAADAPYVIAKGVDDLAFRIRHIAEKNGTPILEIPDLTRAIYYSTRMDQEVPAGLYSHVAHVLMYVLQLNEWKAKRSHKPAPLPKFDIPDSLKR